MVAKTVRQLWLEEEVLWEPDSDPFCFAACEPKVEDRRCTDPSPQRFENCHDRPTLSVLRMLPTEIRSSSKTIQETIDSQSTSHEASRPSTDKVSSHGRSFKPTRNSLADAVGKDQSRSPTEAGYKVQRRSSWSVTEARERSPTEAPEQHRSPRSPAEGPQRHHSPTSTNTSMYNTEQQRFSPRSPTEVRGQQRSPRSPKDYRDQLRNPANLALPSSGSASATTTTAKASSSLASRRNLAVGNLTGFTGESTQSGTARGPRKSSAQGGRFPRRLRQLPSLTSPRSPMEDPKQSPRSPAGSEDSGWGRPPSLRRIIMGPSL